MKRKTLFLKKEVIADLTHAEMGSLHGGGVLKTDKSCPCEWQVAGPNKKIVEESIFACAMPKDTKTYIGNCEFSGDAHFGCPTINDLC